MQWVATAYGQNLSTTCNNISPDLTNVSLTFVICPYITYKWRWVL